MTPSLSFYSHGKLLITGEYLVLHNALALGVPVKFGQKMTVECTEEPTLTWNSYDPDGQWFSASFTLPGLRIIHSTHNEVGIRLQSILTALSQLNPVLFNLNKGYKVITELEFRKEWGLGSSSTLIHNLAQWGQIDPYALLWSVTDGSGYDIACGSAQGPITYRINKRKPIVTPVLFRPPFSKSIYFVYLGNKQDSASGVKAFRDTPLQDLPGLCDKITELTEKIIKTEDPFTFTRLVAEHEDLLSSILQQPSVNETLFRGFPIIAKSLGAWGGDFAMVYSELNREESGKAFASLGLGTYFPFDELLIQPNNISIHGA